jgi:hypothetical protein
MRYFYTADKLKKVNNYGPNYQKKKLCDFLSLTSRSLQFKLKKIIS